MRTGAARGQAGHFHEAGFYGSDIEFRALIVPFAEEGIAAGEPVIIGYDDRKNAMVRSWLTDPSAVVSAVAGRTGRDSAMLYDLLYGGPPHDDTALLNLSGELDALTQEVRRP